MTDQSLLSQVQQLRLQAFQGSAWAATLADECELELRNRLKRHIAGVDDRSTRSFDRAKTGAAENAVDVLACEATLRSASRAFVDGRSATGYTMIDGVGRLLRNVRELLAMDIVLVLQCAGKHLDSHCVDAAFTEPASPRQADRSFSSDRQLPPLDAEPAAPSAAQGSTATRTPGSGSYLRVPVVLASGEVYGTLCCISHQDRSVLGCLQIDALRSVAALAANEIDKQRGIDLKH